ncbi:relaxin receptor 2-like [Limulus polyphemus]|uniref:Relaxin receptor 2-like n=1 Tax=Limulus polyphemus TaxID=6850 RepID=A0ABM1SDQ6_LIMPO|nr:relaxin receptor 2-like [Limulus polyphemus]
MSKNRSSKPDEQCSRQSFPCNHSELCVEQRFNCDGKPDCPDGSDEWKCEFQEITNGCRCHGNHLFCEHQNLRSVPKPLPSIVTLLNLAHNRIRKLKDTPFGNMLFLLHLDLAYNSLEVIGEDAFTELSQLESFYFDEFYMCQFAVKVRVCEPRGDGISSVANLLDNVVLRVSVWIVAVLACCGNVFVLMSRLLLREQNAVHSFYIMNLSVADLLMGIYLFIIAGYDVSYRGHYIRHEKQWRHSWKCNLCGLLSTLSSEASVLILTVITIDRYISVLHPISVVEKRRTIKSAFACMATVWSVAVLMSALPLSNIAYYGLEFYGNNGVCLPLHIHNPFFQAWEYSTFLFCGLNTVAFVFILYAYISMFFTISASKIGLRSTQQQQDRTIAKRFAFIVGTDFLCWIPVVLIKLIALGGIEVDKTLYAWIAVFLLPVNSALNPILYTLTTTVFKQQLSRILISCRSSRPLGKNVDSSGMTSSTTAHRRNPKRAVLVVYSEVDHNKSLIISANRHSCTQKHRTSKCSKARKENSQDVQAV